MRVTSSPNEGSARRTNSIVFGGIVAFAVAMGIGRFAATPLLPLMIRDGTLSVSHGAEWAMANYGGYLIGAITAAWLARRAWEGLLVALTGVTVATIALGWQSVASAHLAGLLLRGAAGVFSAWALVCASEWYLGRLAARGASSSGALIFAGVGLGIAVTGTLTWLGGEQQAQRLWLELGLIASAGGAFVWMTSGAEKGEPSGHSAPQPKRQKIGRGDRHWGLILCYGTFGFGYIVPATFLPVMARDLVSNPFVFGIMWPLFGISAATSVAVVAWRLQGYSRRRIWAVGQGVMAAGTALPLVGQNLWFLAAAALLVGGTFMVTTMAGLQLARELAPWHPAPLLARMTAAFATGQIVGPLLVRAIGPETWLGYGALYWASGMASVLLAATAAWLWRGSSSFLTMQKENP